ncbi:MAG: isoprenylcysteine carboxylmethyltransferase family protein [Dehalococcoidia bacterium]|nr:isoprenylcysteine carboxylmethyltransferase family protein [Dehalococcoidia bacterium]
MTPLTAAYPARRARRLSALQDGLLVGVSVFFLFVHARNALVDHQLTSLPFAAEQLVLVGIFLCRRRSRATSGRFLDWAVAAGGAWLPLAMQLRGSAPLPVEAAGLALQVAGACFVVGCFVFLGRSFGVVAANRGLKTHGPYRLVRHPIYLGHALSALGFVLVHPAWVNVALYATVLACQLLRIRAEERVLTETAEYAAYRARVRWRLIPLVY